VLAAADVRAVPDFAEVIFRDEISFHTQRLLFTHLMKGIKAVKAAALSIQLSVEVEIAFKPSNARSI
jgi:hypothetical protein